MRPIITVHATADEKTANHWEVIRRLSRAFKVTYGNSRGGTRTPDPVINSHLSPPEERAMQGRPSRQSRTPRDAKGQRPATVCATAQSFDVPHVLDRTPDRLLYLVRGFI